MEKAKYNINCEYIKNGERVKGPRPIPGYIFYYGGLRLGVTNKYYTAAGEIETGSAWRLSELTTGLAVPVKAIGARYATNYYSRKALIDAFIKNPRCGRGHLLVVVREAVERWTAAGNQDFNPDLQPADELLAAV